MLPSNLKNLSTVKTAVDNHKTLISNRDLQISSNENKNKAEVFIINHDYLCPHIWWRSEMISKKTCLFGQPEYAMTITPIGNQKIFDEEHNYKKLAIWL